MSCTRVHCEQDKQEDFETDSNIVCACFHCPLLFSPLFSSPLCLFTAALLPARVETAFTISPNQGANPGDELNPSDDGFYRGFNLCSVAHPEGLRMKDLGNGAHGYGLIYEGGGNAWTFAKF